MHESLEQACVRLAENYHYDEGELQLLQVQALCRIADHLTGIKPDKTCG